MRVLDLTHTIAENMPVYPGTETPIFAGANTYEKDGFKETKLTMYTHTGTHMDPPAHLFAGRTTLDAFPASQFIGKALVIECSDLNEGKAITLERILQYGKDAENADFLLFHLGWDKRWGTDAYFGDYPCLDDAAMDYIIAGDYKGIGKPQFVLGAGAAELVARVAVCLLLPAALAGGVVSAEAPQAAVYGLCVADPFAWMSADAVLCIPFFRNIMKEDYRYLYSGSGQGLVNGQ